MEIGLGWVEMGWDGLGYAVLDYAGLPFAFPLVQDCGGVGYVISYPFLGLGDTICKAQQWVMRWWK